VSDANDATAPTAANVLLIVVDQWRGDTLPIAGHPCVQTPNIDRLCARGVTFLRHYSQSAPCAPGRTSMLTGMYQANHRVVRNGTPLDARHTNLAFEVRKAGYEPMLTGYTTSTPDPRQVDPSDPRFQVTGGVIDGFSVIAPFTPVKRPYFAYMRRRGHTIPKDPTDIWLPKPDFPDAEGRGPTFAPTQFPAEDSDSAYFTDHALDYLQHNYTRPWFMHLGYWRPHPPFIAPEPYHDMFDPADVPAPVRAASVQAEADQHPLLDRYLNVLRQEKFFQHGRGSVSALNDEAFRQVRATYYGMIAEVDHHVGRVLDWLESSGQIDNTLIIFTSDHGEQLGDHYMLGKQGYFGESFHIPMIVCDPRAEATSTRGKTVRRFTETIDLMPTVLDWLDRPIPRQCDGRSLMPFCHGKQPKGWRAEVHYEFDFRNVRKPEIEQSFGLRMDQCNLAVIQGKRFKYVHFAGLPPLFFDLEEDSGQLNNLANDAGYQSAMLECTQKLLSWRMENNERILTGMQAGPGGLAERH